MSWMEVKRKQAPKGQYPSLKYCRASAAAPAMRGVAQDVPYSNQFNTDVKIECNLHVIKEMRYNKGRV